MSEVALRGRWPTKDGRPPPDIPICGFNGEKCAAKHEEEYVGIILGASISASVVFTLAVAVHLLLRRYRRLQFLQSMLWQVKLEEIDFLTSWIMGSIRASFRNLHKRKLSSKVSKRSQHKGHYNINILGYNKKGNQSPDNNRKHLDHGGMFGSVASVRGSLTSVKRLSFRVNVSLTKSMTLDLNQLMEIKHQNVCAFVGAFVEANRVLLFWEYCAKGSLQDIIWNQNIKLEDMFRFALCHDVAKGLEFIHKSSIRYHGNLKSTNCVVDSRWTCKITDFGVPSLRALEKMSAAQNGEEENCDKMLWMAPEVLLRRKDIDRQKADIFSLGIILKEVFTRSGPYSEYPFLTSYEIVSKVRDNVGGSNSFRPMIPIQLRQHSELTSLMEDCWQDDPTHRPTATRVLKALNRINPSKNLTMIDNMIAMLEKYANHLEDLVAERTSELDAEKKKTENLLYRMLPQSVAEDLKLGKPIKAEHFDEVTIYFSDIVGFTTICASSTPIEVVNLLNSLYTLFDATITRYDVYKVETIGDAYMIASGLPQRNGKKHIREIADCALDILASIATFRVPHQPDKNVKIRIGIHTGPVVTGVVGLAMPRYCLFGDTVNTASRMESNGLPLRIHMSEVSKKQLVQYPGYHLKSRGEITVKGKGKMKTYFLCGKDGFTKELPNWDEKETTEYSNNVQRPSVTSVFSDMSFVSCASSSSPIVSPSLSVSVSDIWDQRYKAKQTSILEVTCL
ncbi:hypothetical protein ACJMK2_020836 [Sinanodonta woodiana]|uniref:Guanylate cyclase n=1 Tax=Sinanodonta woodiana TaxID=1069815 RepID=A0ABD3U0Q0_SINWO